MITEIKPYLHLILCSVFSLVLGMYFGQELKTCANLEYGNKLSTEFEKFDLESRDQKESTEHQEFASTVGQSYSCNPQVALERLARLHKGHVELDKRREKGEANRARTSTIFRKAVAAGVAENSFRSCLQLVMPEMLEAWDKKVYKGGISPGWDEDSEKKVSGITLAELEAVANEIESTPQGF